MIADLLSAGERCAAGKMKYHTTTLSHHMKTLCGCGLVTGRKEGKWTQKSLNLNALRQVQAFVEAPAKVPEIWRGLSRAGSC